MSTRAADVIRRKRRDGALHTRHATWRINERMMAPLGTNAGSEADANTIADCEFQVKGKPNVEGSDDGSIGLGCFVSWSAKSVTYNGAASDKSDPSRSQSRMTTNLGAEDGASGMTSLRNKGILGPCCR